MKIKTTIFIAALLSSFQFCFSQEPEQTDDKKCSVDVTADFVSRYVWRGVNLSESPSIQPTMAFSYKGITLGSWASYSTARETFQEADLFLTYETKHLNFTIYDYYNPLDTLGNVGDYFHLKNKTTRHTLEGIITLNGSDNFPLTFTAGMMFYGNDRGDDGENQYSTYFELSYASKIQDVEVTPFVGFTPAKGFYAEKSNFVNVGITAVKSIQITDKFQLPLKASFIVNPEKEMVYFVLGTTF